VRHDINNNRVGRKPNRRQQRLIRQTTKYREIKRCLGTNDHDTLLLYRLADVHHVDVGQPVNGPEASPAHVVVGLSAELRLEAGPSGRDDAGGDVRSDREFTVSAPWMTHGLDREVAQASISRSGLVLIIDRRHLHLVERSLLGRVEPVGPIAVAFRLVKPVPEPATTTIKS